MPGSDDEIIITALLRDELSAPAERVQEAIEDIGDSAQGAATDLDALTEAERRNAEQSERTARQLQAERQQRDSLGRFIGVNATNVDIETGAVRRNTRTRQRNNKTTKSATQIFSRLTKVMMPLAKAFVALDLLAQGAAGLGALGAAGVAAASGIGQMSGVLLPLPALLTGMAQGGIVAKFAFKGMSEAAGALANGDFAAFAEATKDMPDSMTASARALGELGQQWKPLVKDLQGRVWEGFSEPISNIGGKLMPMLRDSLMGTADALNVAGKDFFKFLESERGMYNMNQIMRDNGVISQDFVHGIGQLGQAAVTMLSAVMPVARQMSNDLNAGAGGLNEMIQKNMARITAFAQRGYDIFKRFVGILVDLAKGFYNIAKHSGELTGTMGKGVEDMARKFKEWTQSAEGITRIKQFFQDAKEPLDAIWNLIKQVAIAFGTLNNSANSSNFADSINSIAGMVPQIAELANMTSGKFLPALIDIAQSLLDVVATGNFIGPMSILLGAAAAAAGLLADAFTSLPGPLQTVIGYVITLSLLMRTMAGTAAGAWLLQLAPVQKLINALKVYRAVMIMAAKATILQFLGALKTAFMTASAAAYKFLAAQIAAFVSSPIGWIIIAVVALVAAFVLLWKNCEGFRNIVKAIGQWFVDVWNNQIYPMVMATWEWIKMVWDKIWGFVAPIISAIANWFKDNWGTIKAIAMGVFKAIQIYAKVWWTILKTYIMVLVTIFKTAFNIIKTVVMIIWPILKNAFLIWWGAVKLYITILVGIFKIAWSVIKLAFMVVWTAIKVVFLIVMAIIAAALWVIVNVFKIAWNVIKWAFMVVWNFIKAAINFLTPIVMAVVNTVISIWNIAWNMIKVAFEFVWNIIVTVIRTIIDIVTSVVNTVRSVWDAAWNALSGPVTTVIDVIKGIVNGIKDTVTTVTNAVKDAFTTAFNKVRDVVMPIINGIKSVIDKITDAVSAMKDGIGGALESLPIIGGLFFAGGAPPVGQKSIVGELGPEAFVSHTGKVSMVGQHGPELRQFNTPGYVVPNHVLNGAQDSSVPGNVMKHLGNAMGGGAVATQEQRTTRRLSNDTYMQKESGGDVHLHLEGANLGGMSSSQLKELVKQALREIDRNKKERD